MTSTDTATGRYRIAEIAELSGFSPSTLRYYEQSGVLAASERTPAGYRLYSDRDLKRLRLVARAKDLGCTLEEAAELVQAWDSDECGPVKHRLRTLVQDKVAEVESHLREQAAFADQLRATAAALATRPLDGPCNDSCGCTTTSAGLDDVPDERPGLGTGCGCRESSTTTDSLGPRPRSGGNGACAPIACSLAGDDMRERIADWQTVLAHVAQRTPVPGGLRLELDRSTPVADLAALVDAEQSCCPFFSFAITIDHRGVALEVAAPTDGQAVLTAIFGETL